MRKNCKHYLFQITIQKETYLKYNSLLEMAKFPTHEEYFTEIEQKLLLYEYNPGATYDEKLHIEFLIKKLKAKYNAYSVVYLGQKVEELTLKK